MGDAKRNIFETIEGTAFGLNAEDLNGRKRQKKTKKQITSFGGNCHGSGYKHMTGHVRSHVREVSYVVPYESAIMSAVDIKACEGTVISD